MHLRKIIFVLTLASIIIAVYLVGCTPKAITADWEKTIMQLQNDLLKKEQEIKDLQKETGQGLESAGNKEKEIEALNKQVASLQNTLKEKQKEISKMKTVINSLQEASGETNQSAIKESQTETESTSPDTMAATEDEVETAVSETTSSGPQELIFLSGNSNKRSGLFHVSGGSQTLNYFVGGSEYSVCAIYVMKEGTSLDEQGGFPEVNVMQAMSVPDSSVLYLKNGNYYLDIVSANCEWQVRITKP